jgi:hypothetical protein
VPPPTRMQGLRLEPDGPLRFRAASDEPGPSALLLDAPVVLAGPVAAAGPGAAAPDPLAAAWLANGGATRVRWLASGEADGTLQTTMAPRHAVLLPAAMAILAGLRRAGIEMGERCLVPGDGLATALGRAAAADCGGRILERVEETGRDAVRPLLAIAVDPARLPGVLAAVADGGRVVTLAEPSRLPAIDFYPDVHRRGLTLVIVPPRPAPDTTGALWQRGHRRLERLVETASAAGGGSADVAAGPDGAWTLPDPSPGWRVYY